MLEFVGPAHVRRPGPNRAPRLAAVAVFLLAGLCWAAPAGAQLSAPAWIGRISGDAMTVAGATDLATANGRSTAQLASGNEITLPFGQARIELLDGGQIDLCAPAHLTVLKAGGAITLALDYGRVRVQLNSQVPLTVFTPLIVATPVAIGLGLRDITIGVDQRGEMCALADSGAARMAQQFSGQSLLVPQGGELSLTGGQLNAPRMGPQGCHCELPVSHSLPLRLALLPPVRPLAPVAASPLPAEPPSLFSAKDATVYVEMPPLNFNFASPAPPPDPGAGTLLLISESRVRPNAVFEGRVIGGVAAVPVAASAVLQPAVGRSEEVDRQRSPKRGFWSRLFGKGRRKPSCEGAGCTTGS